ncbi:glycoside hydrolase family 25 protein [Sulfitobacter sabulilitoris]|uniref:Glycoside hydrolase n=1 Tax=Sulfitobacter sabulilitoris TaxID=2562655 RepID=A0A5S3PCF9_9RHOB|nr:GH25 family lysozyme [Sulfitobacter sabulilitoris]TMM51541.1 glycoside hydrolase [Sulfitobacter sabulilitoris]
MTRSRGLLCATLLVLAACGAPQPPTIGTAGVLAFGDTSPVDWPGPGPRAHPVHGIDVARYQDAIDWREARRGGVSFAFIKATEGGDRLDPMFKDHWRGAGDVGLPRGAYHFYYFCTPAAVQARWFIENVPRTRGMLPPVLDLEWNAYSPSCRLRPDGATVRREARTFIDALAAHYGQTPIVYTTPQFFRDTDLGRLRGVEFWLRSTAKLPSEAYPGTRWSFWQYTGTGTVPGASGAIDLNVFQGSKAHWAAWVAARQHR